MLKFEATKPTVFASLLTDVVLLLIMLIGLLRLRLGAGGAFGLRRLLWNQVRWWSFFLALIYTVSLMRISIQKGIIWLILATAAEVPTSVRLPILFHLFFLLIAILLYRRSCS